MTDKELRELDAWIAEHVMEWHPMHRPSIEASSALAVLQKCVDISSLHDWSILIELVGWAMDDLQKPNTFD